MNSNPQSVISKIVTGEYQLCASAAAMSSVGEWSSAYVWALSRLIEATVHPGEGTEQLNEAYLQCCRALEKATEIMRKDIGVIEPLPTSMAEKDLSGEIDKAMAWTEQIAKSKNIVLKVPIPDTE